MPVLARLALIAAAAGAASASLAQPEPSFRVRCGGLREALRTLDMRGDPLVTIQVEGTLTAVGSDSGLVYLAMCAAPDPRVLCVTYEDNGRKAGDTAVLTGAYSRPDDDHVLLDPCLNFEHR